MSRHHRLARQHTTIRQPEVTSVGILVPDELDLGQKAILGLFHLLVAVVPFIFTWFNEELFEFNKMIAVYALTIAIAVVWSSRMISQGTLIWKRTALDIPIALFVLSQIASTFLSIHPRTSFFGYYTRFHGGLLSTLSYALLYGAFVSNLRRQDALAVLRTTCIAALGVSLYAIPEKFGFSPSCWLISEGKEGGVACWVQDVQTRVFGTFGQPNWLAAYVITLLPLSWGWISATEQKVWRGVLAVTSLALLTTLLFTQSRSGVAGLAVGGSLTLLGLGWQWLQQKEHQIGWSWLGVVLGGSAFLIAFFGTPWTGALKDAWVRSSATEIAVPVSPTPTPTTNRLEVGGTDSGEIRKIVWNGAIAVWRRYPWFGSGVETFAYSYYQDRPTEHNLVSEWDFLYNKAHNEFLNYLATTGLVGLAAYCGLLLAVFWTLLRDRSSYFWLKVGLAGGIVAQSISNFAGFSTVMITVILWMFAGLAVLLDEPQPPAVKPVGELQVWQLGGLLFGGIFGLFALNMVSVWWLADYRFTRSKQLMASGYVQEGLQTLDSAIKLFPDEALYHDELSSVYSQLAVNLAQLGEASAAAEFSESALVESEIAHRLNDRHLNFYKSTARTLITLSALKPERLSQAKEVLQAALALSPTDAKLFFNLGLVCRNLGQRAEAQKYLEQAIAMKPNYDAARSELGQLFEDEGEFTHAIQAYQDILRYNPSNDGVAQRLKALEATISATPKNP
jgi:putative inorganic carbon (HCO3(-)) transporter